ncbi:MAG: GIY-YIG nuclease family protein [Nitrosopumilaceae archaeon]|nr:GIY-YIG nuclease family protein [Nitrosopumilaceae archaeon]
MVTISLTFDGYWREVYSNSIPNESGIYCVYTCVHNESKGTVSIQKLIYIGESGKVRERISGHERKTNCWKKKLNSGETLCYSFAPADSTNRKRAEAALIFKHKPTCNDEYVNDFPFEQTTVKSSGKTALLSTSFTV